jgi:hypothetical protein
LNFKEKEKEEKEKEGKESFIFFILPMIRSV